MQSKVICVKSALSF